MKPFNTITPSPAAPIRRVVGTLALAAFLALALAVNGSLPAGAAPAPAERFITINFNDVDIDVFIRFISEVTGTNFIVDDKVRGKVTIISPNKISLSEAFRVFESVLDVHGFTAVKSGDVTKIVPAPEARTKNVTTLLKESAASNEDKVVTQLIQLHYADPDRIQKLLTPLVSKNSVVLAYEPAGTVIITDVQSNISRLLTILKAIDVPATGSEITVYPLERSDAKKTVSILSSMFTSPTPSAKKEATEKSLKFVAHERSNSVVFLASETDTLRIKELIRMLDKETPGDDGNVQVYYLQHAKAEEIVDVLKAVPKKDKNTGDKAKDAPTISQDVTIAADKATNSVVIMGEKSDYALLERIIKKLDIPRAMVYIESLIVEVDVNKSFDLGTEWQAYGEYSVNKRPAVAGGGFSGQVGSSSYTNTTGIKGGTLPPGGSVMTLAGDIVIGGATFSNLAAVVQAYQQDKNVHILSNPQILTMDNEEATITVGKNVAFQTRSAADAGLETYSSYEYRDVGITLKITPHISKDNLVRLSISQEVSKLDDASTTSTDRPTTLKRVIETTVLVENNSTLVIGGLIDEAINKKITKVPLLGDIPVLGWLFKATSDAEEKTNLYVFLTPRVVNSQVSAETLLKDKTAEAERFEPGTIQLYESKDKRLRVAPVVRGNALTPMENDLEGK
ncbi:MAG: type II secretion system secretin GspD [Pseudomonadota bacterium]